MSILEIVAAIAGILGAIATIIFGVISLRKKREALPALSETPLFTLAERKIDRDYSDWPVEDRAEIKERRKDDLINRYILTGNETVRDVGDWILVDKGKLQTSVTFGLVSSLEIVELDRHCLEYLNRNVTREGSSYWDLHAIETCYFALMSVGRPNLWEAVFERSKRILRPQLLQQPDAEKTYSHIAFAMLSALYSMAKRGKSKKRITKIRQWAVDFPDELKHRMQIYAQRLKSEWEKNNDGSFTGLSDFFTELPTEKPNEWLSAFK